jgi:2-polyprenyl-6-methoxyphenol hydroxylase-like FAD-dependent oxidoreductase
MRMGAYFPDLFVALARDGSVPLPPTDILRYQVGMKVGVVPAPIKTLWQSRPFLEQHVRAALSARSNVHILDACEITRLIQQNERITGVVARHRGGEQRGDKEEELLAQLVVDASGRGSRAPQWLASLGFGQVEETSVKIDIGYATRMYRCPASLPTDWKVLITLGVPPDMKRAGVIFPIQGGYWMVTLAGWLRDYPPDDDAGFLEFARSLARPDVYEAIKEAEPITPISVYKYAANRWRHYERMSRLPEGFIVMGDAVCAFNPAYGQGMSVAALEAKILESCLREEQNAPGKHHRTGLPQRFQKAIVRNIQTAWMLSTGEDLRYPEVEGRRSWRTRLFNWYIRHVISRTTSHPLVAAAYFQVSQLLQPVSSLFAPPIIWAVLRGRRNRPHGTFRSGGFRQEQPDSVPEEIPARPARSR